MHCLGSPFSWPLARPPACPRNLRWHSGRSHSLFERRQLPSPSETRRCRRRHFSSGRTEPQAASSYSRTQPPCPQQLPSFACTSGSCPGASSRPPQVGSRPQRPPLKLLLQVVELLAQLLQTL